MAISVGNDQKTLGQEHNSSWFTSILGQ